MVILSIIVVVAILAVVIFIITRPFFTDESEFEPTANQMEYATDEVEYQNILKLMHELDFDFSLGKVAVEDYNSLRDELKKQAAVCLQQSRNIETLGISKGA